MGSILLFGGKEVKTFYQVRSWDLGSYAPHAPVHSCGHKHKSYVAAKRCRDSLAGHSSPGFITNLSIWEGEGEEVTRRVKVDLG